MEQFKNFAYGISTVPPNASATSITIGSNEGLRFPATDFYAVLWAFEFYPDNATAYQNDKAEIVKVTDITSDVLTIERAQQSTSAIDFTESDKVIISQNWLKHNIDEIKLHTDTETRLYELGDPELADVDKIVTTANMKVGAYTVASSPDIPRNITVTHTQVGGVTDTLGTIVIVGTDIDDDALTETITPLEGTIASGIKAFKTVTSATGVGWVINTTEDTITIGQGAELGLPVALSDIYYMVFGMLDFTMLAHNPTTDETLAGTTVDMSAGTYNGSKTARVFVTG